MPSTPAQLSSAPDSAPLAASAVGVPYQTFRCLQCGSDSRNELVQLRRTCSYAAIYLAADGKLTVDCLDDYNYIGTTEGFAVCLKCAKGGLPGLDAKKLRAIVAKIPNPTLGLTKN